MKQEITRHGCKAKFKSFHTFTTVKIFHFVLLVVVYCPWNVIGVAKCQAYMELEVYHIIQIAFFIGFKSMSGFKDLELLSEWVFNVNIL